MGLFERFKKAREKVTPSIVAEVAPKPALAPVIIAPVPEVAPAPKVPAQVPPTKKGGLFARAQEIMAKKAPVEVKPPVVPIAPKVVDVRKLEEVPEAERKTLEAGLITVDLKNLRKLLATPNIIPWQKPLIEAMIVEKEKEEEARKQAKAKAEKVAVEVPKVSPEVEKVLKYDDNEFIFNLSQFSKQELPVQEVLALESLRRGYDAEHIQHQYRLGSMGLNDVGELIRVLSEIVIHEEDSTLRPLRNEMLKQLESYYEIATMNERTKAGFKEIEERRVREEADRPKSPEEMEEKRKAIYNLNDKQVKALYEEMHKTNMPVWQRQIIIQVAFDRGILETIPEIESMPEEEAMKLGIGKVKPPVDYSRFVNKIGRTDRKMFDSFMSDWGIDQSKTIMRPSIDEKGEPKIDEKGNPILEPAYANKELAEWIWAFITEKKVMPKFDELPQDKRHILDNHYRGNLQVKYKEQINKLLSQNLIKSPEAFVGEMWTKYGRQWIPVPPYELGLVKVAYPGGLSEKIWREKFLSLVMKSPYKVGMARAQELFNKHGRFGKMPSMDEFKFAPEIEAAVNKGTDPGDAEAVLKLYEDVGRPIIYEDLLTMFNNSESRAKKAYEAMIEYTDIAFRPSIETVFTEIANQPEGKDRLEYMALTDNRAMVARLIAEKVPRFKADEPGYIDFAYDELLRFLPRTQTALQHLDFIEGEVRTNKDQMRTQLQLELEKIRPSWNNMQVIGSNKDLIKKWADLRKEHADRSISALDFFMRYPEVSKDTARTLEEALKFSDIIKIYGKDGSMSKEMITKLVATLAPKIVAYKPGDDKIELSKDIALLERLNDLYKLITQTNIVEKITVGDLLKDVDFPDAKAFAKGMFKIEWLYPEDYEILKKFMETKLKIPTQKDLFELFKDPAKARFIERMYVEKTLPLGVELDDTTVVRMAEAKGLKAEEIQEALSAYKSGRALPLSALEREKKKTEDDFKAGMRLFREIMERPLPAEAIERIGKIKTLDASQAERVQAFNQYLTELEVEIKGLENQLNQLKREKADLEAGRTHGKHERLGEIAQEVTKLDEKRKNLYAAVREVTTDRWNFLRTLPKIDYTEGQARIKYPDYVTRHVNVVRYGEPEKLDTVAITLEDIHKFWVEPLEAARGVFVEKNKKEPLTNEILEMEPSVSAILEEEKKTGKAVIDHAKKIAVITFMNFAKEQGAYPFEFQMAEVARALDMKDVPIFALPAETPERRMQQFKEWLRFGLTRQEVENWPSSTQYEFIGDDWELCEWSGEPKKRDDIKSQKGHLLDCALTKAKSIQSVAIQFIEPQLLQPIIQEVAEKKPFAPELAEVLDIAQKLKEELGKETEKSLKAMKLSEDAIKSVKKLALEKADCEAKLAELSSELETPVETITAMTVAGPKARKMVIKRKKIEVEKKGKEAELERLKSELDMALAKATPGKQKETLQQLQSEIGETEKKLKVAIGKVERERSAGRDICFLRDEWNTVKLSISEHMASNMARAKENQDRLMAARAGGLATETSIYQKYDKTLREEAGALAELRDYINEVEGQDSERFLCTASEMKNVRSMTPAQVLREEEERTGR